MRTGDLERKGCLRRLLKSSLLLLFAVGFEATLFCQTDRQNSGFTYYTTRMLRNAAMPGPLTPKHKCTVYGDDDSPS